MPAASGYGSERSFDKYPEDTVHLRITFLLVIGFPDLPGQGKFILRKFPCYNGKADVRAYDE